MGWGDEILVTGEARKLYERDRKKRRIKVYGRGNVARWSPIWQNNPIILQPHENERHLRLVNGPGHRPYVDYDRMRAEYELICPGRPFTTKKKDPRLPYRFTDHRCTRGELHFVKPGKPEYVVIEPHNKLVNPNRDWGWQRWQDVVDALPDIPWVQINPTGMKILRGVRHIPAPSFMDACRRLAGAMLYVGPEGGLYHAAAALGVRSVAIFGGFVSPANQGYDDCINLYVQEGSPCGQRVPCQHCHEALKQIKTETVVASVKQLMAAPVNKSEVLSTWQIKREHGIKLT